MKPFSASAPSSWNRRGFLRAGLAAGALPMLPFSASGAGTTAKPATSPKLFLFVDWFHVKKGERAVVLDPQRLTEDGKALLEKYARDHAKIFEQGTHGFRPVDVPSGIRIQPEIAAKSEPWLRADQPWEKGISGATVLHDEGRYRCWYSAKLKVGSGEVTVDQGRVMEVSGTALAYAESKDGFNWVKPTLGILSFEGSRENNLVTGFHNAGAVFRDDHGSPEERYKLFYFAELPKGDVPAGAAAQQRYGLYGVTSPDGYRWTKHERPLIRYFSDTFNIGAWDAGLHRYVGYFRHHFSGRTIARAETEDFWQWPEPQPLLYAGPLDGPADDYYTNGYTTYPDDPSLRLLFSAIYHRDNDGVDVRLGLSRDGRAFQWISHQPVIPLGPPGSWDGGAVYAQPNLVHLPDGRLALPYNAYNTTHNEVWFQNFYGDYGIRSACGWALWQEGRLAGIQADEAGQFTMQAARFDGEGIQINARTAPGGSVEAELRERGKPVAGFAFADAVPFSGDAIWTDCRWRGQRDLAALRGKSLEIGVRLRRAKIFACRFR